MNYIEKVKEFHQQFNQKVSDKQDVSDFKLKVLRLLLLREELNELEVALANDDKIEVLDALCDLQYVLSGTIISFGFQDVFNDAFVETHRSNMSKACANMDEAVFTVAHYALLDQNSSAVEVENGTYNIVRSDGKLLKSVAYSKSNLKPFIQDDSNRK